MKCRVASIFMTVLQTLIVAGNSSERMLTTTKYSNSIFVVPQYTNKRVSPFYCTHDILCYYIEARKENKTDAGG